MSQNFKRELYLFSRKLHVNNKIINFFFDLGWYPEENLPMKLKNKIEKSMKPLPKTQMKQCFILKTLPFDAVTITSKGLVQE